MLDIAIYLSRLALSAFGFICRAEPLQFLIGGTKSLIIETCFDFHYFIAEIRVISLHSIPSVALFRLLLLYLACYCLILLSSYLGYYCLSLTVNLSWLLLWHFIFHLLDDPS